jgi:hypothetical protein
MRKPPMTAASTTSIPMMANMFSCSGGVAHQTWPANISIGLARKTLCPAAMPGWDGPVLE